MSAPAPIAGALYTGEGCPISGGPLHAVELGGMMEARPVCRILCDAEEAHQAENSVDLIFMLPLGAGPHAVASSDLAEMVACLERGGRIALHGTDAGAVAEVVEGILSMVGGGRA